MQAQVYEWLHRINAGFQEVLHGLAALQEHRAFDRHELQRCASLAKETRAVANSYLTGAIEGAETEEAGRRYHQRRRRERRDETGM